MINYWADMLPGLMFNWMMPLSIVDPSVALSGDPIERPNIAPTGQFIARDYLNECGSLHYKLYIPSGYSGQTLPLLVMLHGCSQGADDFASGTRMNSVAEEKQCFVVYPEQAASANCSKCWNWFNENDQRRDCGEPAIIAGIAREVMDEYNIDRSRVFIAGLSAGGAMAVIMGQTYPDLFTAVGSHSGLPYGAARDAASALDVMRNGANAETLPLATARFKRIPIIVFQGDGDTTVHPSNGAGIIAQSLRGAVAGSNVPLGISVRQGAATGRKYTSTVHCNSQGEIMAEEWMVHGAGHAWSGGDDLGTCMDTHGPDAGTEMMRFFMPEHGI
jgi:poly(hydroxyalkanoate) depolymerase family esterase